MADTVCVDTDGSKIEKRAQCSRQFKKNLTHLPGMFLEIFSVLQIDVHKEQKNDGIKHK